MRSIISVSIESGQCIGFKERKEDQSIQKFFEQVQAWLLSLSEVGPCYQASHVGDNEDLPPKEGWKISASKKGVNPVPKLTW